MIFMRCEIMVCTRGRSFGVSLNDNLMLCSLVIVISLIHVCSIFFAPLLLNKSERNCEFATREGSCCDSQRTCRAKLKVEPSLRQSAAATLFV